MDFNEYKQRALEESVELRKEYDALQPEYEIIEKLISARNEANLTQKELAKKCGLKQSNISRLESGKANPTLKFLKKLADSLDCDLVVEFRKREPATETCKVMNESTLETVSLGKSMDKFVKVGTTHNTGTYTA